MGKTARLMNHVRNTVLTFSEKEVRRITMEIERSGFQAANQPTQTDSESLQRSPQDASATIANRTHERFKSITTS